MTQITDNFIINSEHKNSEYHVSNNISNNKSTTKSNNSKNQSLNDMINQYGNQYKPPEKQLNKAQIRMNQINQDIDNKIKNKQENHIQEKENSNILNNFQNKYKESLPEKNRSINQENIIKSFKNHQKKDADQNSNTTFKLLDSSKSSSIDIDELVDNFSNAKEHLNKSSPKKDKGKENEKNKDFSNQLTFNQQLQQPTTNNVNLIKRETKLFPNKNESIYESQIQSAIRLNSFKRGNSSYLKELIASNNINKFVSGQKKPTNRLNNNRFQSLKTNPNNLSQNNIDIKIIKQNQIKANRISKREQMENLKKNTLRYKKSNKINKKSLNEDLRMINKIKTSSFVSEFKMSKREQMEHVKNETGISGQVPEKTVFTQEQEIENWRKEQIQSNIAQARSVSKREYMEVLRQNSSSKPHKKSSTNETVLEPIDEIAEKKISKREQMNRIKKELSLSVDSNPFKNKHRSTSNRKTYKDAPTLYQIREKAREEEKVKIERRKEQMKYINVMKNLKKGVNNTQALKTIQERTEAETENPHSHKAEDIKLPSLSKAGTNEAIQDLKNLKQIKIAEFRKAEDSPSWKQKHSDVHRIFASDKSSNVESTKKNGKITSIVEEDQIKNDQEMIAE